ncbi:hypothetical protein [Paenibacillus donghaensis]|uniref:Uncharacterized protein n=1 Tax=Paenibacillus donghaensis TaxID=414771 RepID=A0A2Z2KN53_9BACL|nr:hypothetical protein [Paenibacillus donghaensis]ASA22602.1 hypothetical protein B9T62_18520 [Paenibacillus donghaensis]
MKIEDKNITGFTVRSTNEKVIIEMPISNLVRGFNASPNNWNEAKIRRGKRKEFAKWLIENLLDEADTESGDNFIVTMLDSVYERAFEGAEDEFVKYNDEY